MLKIARHFVKLPFMIGTVVSHYKILEKLGEGGMGIVYKAHDTTLDRIVALKFLPSALTADPAERERFYQEARTASQLLHPNVTTIFEISETAGQIYLAMELVEGRTLRRLIQEEEPLAFRKALDLAIQMFAGLSAAHEKGIVHRDIKSENILVSTKGEVKITDFGLAKLKGASKLTKTGSTLGTAAYMSPEQARGEDVDARSDIFSAGVVLYELLTGKLPFRGEHQAALLYSLINEEPLPLARYDEKISAEMQRIVIKALAKEREDRYQHADEMLADLRRERKGMEYARSGSFIAQPAQAGKKNEPAGSGQTFRPKRTKMTLLAAGVIIICAAAGIYFFRGKQPGNETTGEPAPNKIAVLPFESLGPSEREYFADGLTDEIRTKLSGLSGLAVIARASSVQYKKTEKSLSEIGSELNVGYLLQGTIRWEEGDSAHHGATRLLVSPTLVKISDGTQVWSQSFGGTLSSVFEIQSTIAQQVAQALAVVLNPSDRLAIEAKPTENAEAYDYYLRGQQDLALATPLTTTHALAMFGKAVALDPKFTAAYAQMCRAYAFRVFQGQGADSLRALAKKSLDKVLDLDPNSFQADWAQGYYYYYGWRNYEQALRYFSLVLQFQPNNADIISSIGFVKRRQGKFQESRDLLAKSCDLDPKSWRNWFELGFVELVMRSYSSADEHFKRSMLLFGKKSTSVAAIHSLAVFSKRGDLKAARKIFDDEVDETASWSYQERNVQMHLAEGNLDAAKQGLDRAVLSQPDINPTGYYYTLATVYSKSSQNKEARACLDSAKVLAENDLRINPGDWSARSALGLILGHLGRKKEAIDAGMKAVELMPFEKDAMEAGPGALYGLAEIYAITGEADASIDKLEQLLGMPNLYTTYYIQIDPEFESLKQIPRFTSLMSKYRIQ